MTESFAKDFQKDGVFDGKDDQRSISVGSYGQLLGTDDWSNDLNAAIDSYVAGPDIPSGYSDAVMIGDMVSAPTIELPPPCDFCDETITAPPPTLPPENCDYCEFLASLPPNERLIIVEILGPIYITPEACVPITLTIQDQYGNFSLATSDTDFTFAINSVTGQINGQFYADDMCATTPLTSIHVPQALDFKIFFVKINASGAQVADEFWAQPTAVDGSASDAFVIRTPDYKIF